MIGVLLHEGNAAFAAFTAALRSSFVDIGTVESKVPSIGEITSKVLSEEAGTNFPLMKFWTAGYFIKQAVLGFSENAKENLCIFLQMTKKAGSASINYTEVT